MFQKLMLSITVVCVALASWFYSVPLKVAYSQGETEVECGQVLEGEFTNDMEVHKFVLTMDARWSFDVSVEPFGEGLNTVIVLYGPTGLVVDASSINRSNYAVLQKSPSVASRTLSARGKYSIIVSNAPINLRDGKLWTERADFGGVGFYTLKIGCTTADGTKIRPGDLPLPTATLAPLPTPTVRPAIPDSAPAFTGIGFPGLAPVDFSSVAQIPLIPDTVMTGVIPTGNEILGFTLDATAGDILDLSYTRVSGNMNLGLVVLSENNEVFFQASLVTSESLSTTFTLPEPGQYTIGVFRISLVEPDVVAPTVFQLRGSLVGTEE